MDRTDSKIDTQLTRAGSRAVRQYERGRVDGIMAAQVAVAEITGDVVIGDFTPATWQMVCVLHAKLAQMAVEAIEAERAKKS